MDVPPQELQFPSHSPKIRLDRWVHHQLSGPSRTEIQQWIRSGKITVNGDVVSPGTVLTAGMVILISEIKRKQPSKPQPEDLPLEVMMEDPSVVVINKSAGHVVHPAPGHPGGTVLNAMLHHFPDIVSAGPADRPGLVHRLDADTSGLMIFARTEESLQHLQRQFQNRTTEKTYLCVCRGIPNPISQEIQTPIGRHPVHRQKRAIHGANAKQAFTRFRMLRGLAQGNAAELEVEIKTGRTHQIRVHLDSLQHPILGDPLYGGRRTRLQGSWPAPPRLLLHAARLQFTHPETDKRIDLQVSPPEDYLSYCETLETT